MSIEQKDNEEYFHKRKKKLEDSSSQEFFESKKLRAQTSNLLQSLAKEIAIKFGIDVHEVKKLIENKTNTNLEGLRRSLWNNETFNVEALLKDVNNAKYQIENLSKDFREELKKSLHQNSFNPEQHNFYTSQKVFSHTLIQRIQNPQNLRDHLTWAGIGMIDSSEAVIFFLYWLWKWILLTPYHIYLLLTSRGTTKV